MTREERIEALEVRHRNDVMWANHTITDGKEKLEAIQKHRYKAVIATVCGAIWLPLAATGSMEVVFAVALGFTISFYKKTGLWDDAKVWISEGVEQAYNWEMEHAIFPDPAEAKQSAFIIRLLGTLVYPDSFAKKHRKFLTERIAQAEAFLATPFNPEIQIEKEDAKDEYYM